MAYAQWPLWEQFKQQYISTDGRVVDPYHGENKTTSEGQSYGLFFSLVAKDKAMFAKLLQWTQNNLAAGDLTQHLPAWKWGLNKEKEWTVLDKNSASDADLWIAYDLLEAGRLWNSKHYASLGKKLLQKIMEEEVIEIPGLGKMLLPGKYGFSFHDSWRFNPSYLPPQLLARFATIDSSWKELEEHSWRLLLETAPKGYAPDWVIWKKDAGWQPDSKHPNLGSYDAIRVYLWIGMLAQDVAQNALLIKQFLPFTLLTQRLGVPPEQINVLTGKVDGRGSVGFSAALLPLLAQDPQGLSKQRERIAVESVADYYSFVLSLFGRGWDEKRYRFNDEGALLIQIN